MTHVTYRLEPHAGRTRFTFEHTGFTGIGGFFARKHPDTLQASEGGQTMTWIRAHALHTRLRVWLVTIAPLLVLVVAGQCSGGTGGY